MLSLPLSLLLFHTYFSFLTSLSLSLCFSFSSRWIQPRSSQTGEKRQRQQPLTWPPSSHRGDAARVRRPLVLANCRRGWHFTHSWTPPCPKGFVSTQLLMWKSAGKRKRGLRTRWNGNRNQRDAGGKLNLTLKKKNKKKKERPFFCCHIYASVFWRSMCCWTSTSCEYRCISRRCATTWRPQPQTYIQTRTSVLLSRLRKRTCDELDVDYTLLS